jgi:sugar phosphate permease
VFTIEAHKASPAVGPSALPAVGWNVRRFHRPATAPQISAAAELGRRQRLLVLFICCASAFVVMMDISVVNVALPAIRADSRTSESGLQWTVDACTLMLSSFLVPAGSTADRVGRRRAFQTGLAILGAGSVLCGLAPSIGIDCRSCWSGWRWPVGHQDQR